MIHPCRADRDSFGNPHYRLHAFEYDEGKMPAKPMTVCGLAVKPEDVETGWRWQVAYLCDSCYPSTPPSRTEKAEHRDAWTEQNPWQHGLPVGDRGYAEETLLKRYKPK